MEGYSSIAKRLCRFYSGEHEAQMRVDQLLGENPNLTDAQIFQMLSENLGRPSTHMSGYPEEQMMPVSHRGRSRRRRY